MADLYSQLKQYEQGQATKFPTSGTIHGIDSGFVDILVPGSSTILRHVKCVGTPTSHGELVLLTWENSTPTAHISNGSTPSSSVALIRGPQGPPGIQGVQGPKGDTGAQGPAGPSTDVAAVTHAAMAKNTPTDADEFLLSNSVSSFSLAKVTWASVKATLKTYLDSLYALTGHTHDYNKAVAKDPIQPVLGNGPYTIASAWTAFNLTPYTSATAKIATVRIQITPAAPGTGGNSYFRLRKNASTDTTGVYLYAPYTQIAWVPMIAVAMVPLDAGQNIQYRVEPATNAQVYVYIDVLGFFE